MLVVRLKALMATCLFSLIGAVSIFFSIREIMEYYEGRNVILFTWMVPFAFIFSFVMFAASLAPVHVVIRGKNMDHNQLKKLSKALLVLFIFSIIGAILFSMIYTKSVESRGYVRCTETPSGWTPGTATRYTIDQKRCLKLNNF